MKLTSSAAVAILSVISSISAADPTTASSSAAAVNVGIPNASGSGYSSVNSEGRASIQSEIQKMASSQITDSAVAAQLKTITETKGLDLPSAIAKGAADANLPGSAKPTAPAWVKAAGDGAVSSLYYGDQASYFQDLLKAAGGSTAAPPSSTASASATSTNSKGGAAQPTGQLMAAGAAAAGVLGFAALL